MALCRVRLIFDRTFPDFPGKCWFLIDVARCNLVADLEWLIRRKFDIDDHLNLYLDGYLLPSQENIALIRDNEKIRVEWKTTENQLKKGFSKQEDKCSIKKKRKLSTNTYVISKGDKKKKSDNPKKVPQVSKKKKKRKTSENNQDESKLQGDIVKEIVAKQQPLVSKRGVKKVVGKKYEKANGIVNSTPSNVLKKKKTKQTPLVSKNETYALTLHETKTKKKTKKRSKLATEKPRKNKLRLNSSTSTSSSLSSASSSSLSSCSSSSLSSFSSSSSSSNSSNVKDHSRYQFSHQLSPHPNSKNQKSTAIHSVTQDVPKVVQKDDKSSTRPVTCRIVLEKLNNNTLPRKIPTPNPYGQETQSTPTHLKITSDSSSNHIRFDSEEESVFEVEESLAANSAQKSQKQHNPSLDQPMEYENPTLNQHESPMLGKVITSSEAEVSSNGRSTKVPQATIVAQYIGHGKAALPDNNPKKLTSVGRNDKWCNRSQIFSNGNALEFNVETTDNGQVEVAGNVPPPSGSTGATNSAESISEPKDFSKFPSLCGPPRPGDCIAYKEGEVLGYDPTTNEVSLELTEASLIRPEGDGHISRKFELIDPNEDDDGHEKNPPVPDKKVVVLWTAMVDPRLLPAL
ncbi:predicted protein [Nematostella vectensis]|uniref:Coilin N-terminal domain-containing protein n=1 Tax=Nematostella vectensis TaxID=45351 RepID=A7RUE3_NEMVE|nr:predicted protein [Nematostella vectensis]|eukprot:XP_001636950.1 predicted protein [Nematostella vectensis]